jgi:uncharacterized protein with PIN domain
VRPETKIEVMDAGAMLAYLKAEDGAPIVIGLLLDPNTLCIAHAVNVCEVFYDLFRSGGEDRAQEGLRRLAAAKVKIRADMDADFWQDIGRMKGGLARIALADCFGIALARRTGGEFVTSDHHELDRIVPLNLCPIRFFR